MVPLVGRGPRDLEGRQDEQENLDPLGRLVTVVLLASVVMMGPEDRLVRVASLVR